MSLVEVYFPDFYDQKLIFKLNQETESTINEVKVRIFAWHSTAEETINRHFTIYLKPDHMCEIGEGFACLKTGQQSQEIGQLKIITSFIDLRKEVRRLDL